MVMAGRHFGSKQVQEKSQPVFSFQPNDLSTSSCSFKLLASVEFVVPKSLQAALTQQHDQRP
jgi:hypothetical protein